MYRIHILAGNLKGKRFVIREGSITLGRDPACHLRINDPAVAPQHAVIEEAAGKHYLCPAESASVTLNGNGVERALLHHGDRISIGKTELCFEYAEVAQHTRKRKRHTVQLLAATAVALLLISELIFIVSLTFFRREKATLLQPPDHAVSATSTGALSGHKATAPQVAYTNKETWKGATAADWASTGGMTQMTDDGAAHQIQPDQHGMRIEKIGQSTFFTDHYEAAHLMTLLIAVPNASPQMEIELTTVFFEWTTNGSLKEATGYSPRTVIPLPPRATQTLDVCYLSETAEATLAGFEVALSVDGIRVKTLLETLY